MAIVCKYGKPDLFLTYTCNPKSREITNNLGPNETAQNRPDLISRVYKAHLHELMIDIKDRHILGVPVAHVHVIEFQKRGLPHCHMLIILRDQDKLRTTQQIDAIVSAEIPDRNEPLLRELVRTMMIHGPCGTDNPNSICMINGKCQKSFPKKFQEETNGNIDGYPAYRRRNNGEYVEIGRYRVDNRYVVPYNKYLLKKYQAHINLEVCSSVKSVKYIFKYVYKGHDCAMMEINNRPQINNAEEETNINNYDEIKQFLSCRYVSPVESMWRLSENKMHGQSHTIYRLAVHLPGEQNVYYNEGQERQAAEHAVQRDTHLTAWFKLNQIDHRARNLLYCEIPEHYVFDRKNTKWTSRVRKLNVITRMYSVSPKQIEKFHLRLLLLHVPGATSFENLRTVQGIELQTFKETCIRMRLLDDDAELRNTLREAATFRMPRQLLSIFATICIFNHPVNALQLWNEFKEQMMEDVLRNTDEATAQNITLHRLNKILNESGMSCSSFGLPQSTGEPPLNENRDQIAPPNLDSLNNEQREVVNQVMAAITTA